MPARPAAVQAQLAARVRGTPAAHWPVFPVSSLDGTGIDALAAHLREQAAHFAARTAGGNFRMAIDRSFTLAGIGTIVAGTVHAGRGRGRRSRGDRARTARPARECARALPARAGPRRRRAAWRGSAAP